MVRIANFHGATLVRSSSLATLATALAFAFPAAAQDRSTTATPEATDRAVDSRVEEPGTEIVITGSRINTAGFGAPTPTTVVGVAELRQAGSTDIGAALADLPQFRQTQGSQQTNTTTTSGQAPADLRGLGIARTLVLINNRRHISSNDLQTVPYTMVRRVDVVTGGASAAYGSGAVAGVVNIILDDRFEGFKLGAQTGISSRDDRAQYLLEGSMGLSFADGRGHVVIGADYLEDEGIAPASARPLVGDAGFFPGEDGRLYPTLGIRESNRSEGGLINSGVLAGQTFNADGSLSPFRYGIRRPGAPTSMIGGDGFTTNKYRSVSAPISRLNGFARASFDVADNLTFWVEGSYNRVSDSRFYWPDLGVGQITLSATNPFLSQSIRDRLAAAGEPSFVMGRALSDMALARYDYDREAVQGTIGLDGSFGGGRWRYNAYYAHGEQKQDQFLRNITLRTNFANAIDAVRAPNGSIVCRVALTDPTTPCRPLNLFGSGNADPAAIAYATADWNSVINTWLDNAGASISGEPLSFWGRPVSVAAGVEYREEAYENLFDENALARRFSMINGTNIPKTGNSVTEAFAEVNIPVLADLPAIRELNLNGAVRVSDYSTSGAIWSWKIGGIWDIVDGLKLRATRSRDIRAASLTELFSQRAAIFGPVNDLGRPGNPSTQVILYQGGNPDLRPEIADTLTFGVVISPRALPGLNLSVDYYDIKIRDVITTLTAQQIVNGCYLQSNQGACSQITRDGNGAISSINASFINIADFRNNGVDFEASYRTRLDAIGLGGQLSVRALVNYVDKLIVDNGVVAIDGAGYLGSQAVFLVPRWRGLVSATYESSSIGADIRTRYVGGGGFAPASVLPNQAPDLHVDSRIYVDLGLRGYVGLGGDQRITIYGNVQNLFDRAPELGAASPYHDFVGRYFTFGVRASF
ncbi:TonB-dependent receptor [Sphingosinicella sp. LHD-64]|uniref:TonB-dependent receptor plug domain-containing protein n=1 Tax=Sphingosinicella sp. LHD-64 TaxID=3072139 RepID=UPI0028103B57|nr:TonB-dependent receptor [Sphingosinicella sp. LHD-64]MDQ8757448.1 TonB-dependent receptor [Sphingosinicella sp. LHD-64]